MKFTRLFWCVPALLVYLIISGYVDPNDYGKEIRYVAVGDSYTIGTGATPEKSWPMQLVVKFRLREKPFTLVANLARAGWTTREVIDYQLPQYKTLIPNFATILIGTNDWVRGMDEETFRKNFAHILDEMIKVLPDPQHLLVLTLPDFSVTPKAKDIAGDRDISAGLAGFNAIITEEAKKRTLRIVDLFSLAGEVKEDPALISYDGIHPSVRGYNRWADVIYEEVKDLY